MFFEIIENGSFSARSGMALKRCTYVDFEPAGGSFLKSSENTTFFTPFSATSGQLGWLKGAQSLRKMHIFAFGTCKIAR